MHTITVPTIRSFEHAGRYVAAGESLTVSPVEALALARRGVVSLTKGYQTRAVVAEQPPADAFVVEDAPTPTRRRRRKVGDGEAETPKRRYRRRDLTAEP